MARNKIVDKEAVQEAWDAGAKSHAELARRFGVSRARIGQILSPIKKELGPDIMPASIAAKRVHVNPATIQKWIRDGDLLTVHGRISLMELREHMAALAERPCRVCGAPIGTYKFTSCPKHRFGGTAYQSYPYRIWSESRRAKFKVWMKNWADNNPEKSKTILKRAQLVYRLMRVKGLSREEAHAIADKRVPYPWRGES